MSELSEIIAKTSQLLKQSSLYKFLMCVKHGQKNESLCFNWLVDLNEIPD